MCDGVLSHMHAYKTRLETELILGLFVLIIKHFSFGYQILDFKFEILFLKNILGRI